MCGTIVLLLLVLSYIAGICVLAFGNAIMSEMLKENE